MSDTEGAARRIAEEPPRELTAEEVRDRFLSHCWEIVEFWEKETRAETVRDRIRGAVFSVLVAIDGEGVGLPAFVLAPHPHERDRAFHQQQGEDWFPEWGPTGGEWCDIGGGLHERFFAMERKKEPVSPEQALFEARNLARIGIRLARGEASLITGARAETADYQRLLEEIEAWLAAAQGTPGEDLL